MVLAVAQPFNNPDLLVSDIILPELAASGDLVNISYTVTNQGGVDAIYDRDDAIYFSNDNIFDESDTLVSLESIVEPTALATGESETISTSIRLPDIEGEFSHLLVVADRSGYQPETDEQNNTAAISLEAINYGLPDLLVSELQIEQNVAPGDEALVTWTVTNEGNLPALDGWQDGIFLSADDRFDEADRLISQATILQAPVAPGSSYTASQRVRLPQDLPDLPYLLLASDHLQTRSEKDERNNIEAILHGATYPDLSVTALELDRDIATTGESVDVTYTVTNLGNDPASGQRRDAIYLSKDAQFDRTDVLLGFKDADRVLQPEEQSTVTQTVEIPLELGGYPYLLVVTDRDRQILELDESGDFNRTNNVAFLNAIAFSNLAVTDFTTPLLSRESGELNLSWSVTNQSEVSLLHTSWYDTIYASSDEIFDSSDLVIDSVPIDNELGLEAEESYSVNHLLRLPDLAADRPYLFIVSDGLNRVVEVDETDNVRLLEALPDGEVNPYAHVAAVVNGENSTIELYVDGQLRVSKAIGDLTDEVATSVVLGSTTQPLKGKVDEVRIFDSARSPVEIQASLNRTLTSEDSGLVGYWQFNGSAEGLALDSAGNRDGIIQGDVQRTGNAAPVIDRTAGAQLFEYDSTFSQLTSFTDELGRQTFYEIDPTNGNTTEIRQVVGQDDRTSGETDDIVTQFTYTAQGLLDTVTDALGRITDNDYDNFGRLISTTMAVGTADQARIQYEYDLAGNLTAYTDENGNLTRYDYDALNRLIRIVEADPDGAGPQLSPVTQFAYDKAGNLLETIDANDNFTRYEYEERDRLSKSVNALGNEATFEYDGQGNLIAETDFRGNTTAHLYDSRNRRIASIDPEGGTTQFDYDLDNNLIRVVDPRGNSTGYSYDARDLLVSTIDADGNFSRYEYDAVNNLVAIGDRNQNRTEFIYDELNRLTASIDPYSNSYLFTYDKLGNVVGESDERGHGSQFEYDARNRLVKAIDAKQGKTEFRYDAVGNLLWVEDELKRRTQFEFDALNRQIVAIDPLLQRTRYTYDAVGNLKAVEGELDRITSYDYDHLNRVETVSNAYGDTITYIYDANGNIVALTDELERTTRYSYDKRNWQTAIANPLGHTTTTAYDANGNVVSVTDPLGNITRYAYDQLDRQTEVTDANGDTTQFAYDAEGNLKFVLDPEQNRTEYVYDRLDRVVEESSHGDLRTYAYDASSNLTAKASGNGYETVYAYDELNRRISEQGYNDKGEQLHDYFYEFDATDQLTAAGDDEHRYSYTYDAAGRTTSVSNAGSADVPEVEFAYGYDAANNRTSVTDSINGVEAGRETFEYDLLDRVTRITQSGANVAEKSVRMEYDAVGQTTSVDRYGDLAETREVASSTYRYDRAGRLERLTHANDSSAIADYGFTYDAANRLTQMSSPNGEAVYSYDRRSQLTGAEYSDRENEEYSYDSNGNRTNEEYVTQERNQLLEDRNYAYTYDGEGNRITRVDKRSGQLETYEWDHRNRLKSVVTTKSDGTIVRTVDNAYDVFDRRISKIVDLDGAGPDAAKLEHYVHDGEHIALIFSADGSLQNRFLHGVVTDRILAQEDAEGHVFWALEDHLGSVQQVVNSDGETVKEFRYDSFGNIVSESNPELEFKFTYAGREYDSETGLYYNRARYVDANTGKFISLDPIGFKAGDSNLYRYVGNTPTTTTDPSGKVANFVVGAAVGGAVDLGFQLLVNRGDISKVDWLSVGMSTISGAAGGAISNQLAKQGARFLRRTLVSSLVGGVVDGLLQVGRNGIEGNHWTCDVLSSGLTGMAGGALGEVVDGALGALGRNFRGSSFGKVVDEAINDIKFSQDISELFGGINESSLKDAPPINSIEELAELSVNAVRIRQGTNGKYALVGRGMGQLKANQAILKEYGINAVILDKQIPLKIRRELKYALENNVNSEQLKQLEFYEFNRKWAERLREKGYTVIDTGDPLGLSEEYGPSVFYDLEESILFTKGDT